MCYDYDSDWYMSIREEDMAVCKRPTSCDDCGHKISPGEQMRVVTQIECLECQNCGEYYSETGGRCVDPDDAGCEWESHDFGEQYHGEICLGCCRVREAIRAIEAARGCPEGSQVPPYGNLVEDTDRDSLASVVAARPDLLDVPWVFRSLTRDVDYGP